MPTLNYPPTCSRPSSAEKGRDGRHNDVDALASEIHGQRQCLTEILTGLPGGAAESWK